MRVNIYPDFSKRAVAAVRKPADELRKSESLRSKRSLRLEAAA